MRALLLLLMCVGLLAPGDADAQSKVVVVEAAEWILPKLGRLVVREQALELQIMRREFGRLPQATRQLGWVEEGDLFRRLATPAEARAFATEARAVTATRPALEKLGLQADALLAPRIARAREAEQLVPIGEKVPILAQDLRSFRLIRAAHPKQPVLLQRTTDLSGLAQLTRPVRRVFVHADVPSSEPAFRRVYGQREPMSPNVLAELKDVAARLDRFKPKPGERLAASKLKQAVEEGAPDVLHIVVAHNENGLLHFADGSKLIISDLAANSRGVKLLVVSCNTLSEAPRHGALLMETAGNVSWSKAADVVEALVPTGKPPPPDMAGVMERVSKVSGAFVGIATAMVFVVDHEEKGQQ